MRKARLEARRAEEYLGRGLGDAQHPEFPGWLVVRPPLAIVGWRLRSMPAVLDPSEVAAVFACARRSTTWAPLAQVHGERWST